MQFFCTLSTYCLLRGNKPKRGNDFKQIKTKELV